MLLVNLGSILISATSRSFPTTYVMRKLRAPCCVVSSLQSHDRKRLVMGLLLTPQTMCKLVQIPVTYPRGYKLWTSLQQVCWEVCVRLCCVMSWRF